MYRLVDQLGSDGEHIIKDKLYRRYGQPQELMKTYSLQGLARFLLYLIEQEQDDVLWELWLAKDVEDDYATFRQKKKQLLSRASTRANSAQLDREILERNSQYIKPIQPKEVKPDG